MCIRDRRDVVRVHERSRHLLQHKDAADRAEVGRGLGGAELLGETPLHHQERDVEAGVTENAAISIRELIIYI